MAIFGFQFCPQEEQNIFKFEAVNNMASMKSWISPDLLNMQQHFIIAATFKAITASIFIMKQVLFVSKKII